jgi:hypothetical protein
MPERDRFGPGEPYGARCVTVIERPWKGDDPYPHPGSLPGTAD